MEGYYAEDGVQLFFISSEDRKKKTPKTERLELHQGRLGLEMKKQVLGEGLWDVGMNTEQDYEIPIFGILKLMWSAWIDVAW